MRALLGLLVLSVACGSLAALPMGEERPISADPREISHEYFWRSTPVDGSAQLLTLFCRACLDTNGANAIAKGTDVPLVTLMRDTLGDTNPENDRVTYVWLLTYARPNVGKEILSAVPFFYWRVSNGSEKVSKGDTAPLMDLTAPQHPVLTTAGRDLLQWFWLDSTMTPIRATSRTYRANAIDEERLHLEETVSYLRNAPSSEDSTAPTSTQINTVIARLELRKKTLGGLMSEKGATRLGEEDSIEQERIRAKNWELLRQCAEKTGLTFEPLKAGGNSARYAILWFRTGEESVPQGTNLGPIWKLLDIKNPWTDARLKNWKGATYVRTIDENGSLLRAGTEGAKQKRMVPLAVYSLTYPKVPLLVVDFRDKLHTKRHEIEQRAINEITAGVIGVSHFTNWYYFVAADLYDFIVSRHGGAMDQASRLDCYSQFRAALALDHELDPKLRKEMQARADSLAVNPLESRPDRELAAAHSRYELLLAEAVPGGKLVTELEKNRRAELAEFGASERRTIWDSALHDASFGRYTRRVKKDDEIVARLDRQRRIEYNLRFLDSLTEAGTQPEVAYDASRIQASVKELSSLLDGPTPADLRTHATGTLRKLNSLSQDTGLRSDCLLAVDQIAHGTNSIVRPASAPGTVAMSSAGASAFSAASELK